MKILLDTNILIHRESNRVINQDIGLLFYWLDKMGYEKWIHPDSINEIENYQDRIVVETIRAKIQNYRLLNTLSEDNVDIQRIRKEFDNNRNDEIDTNLLKEVHNQRIEYFITEDRKIHKKAKSLNIHDKVFTIDSIIEKLTFENPDLIEYPIPSIKKIYFGNIDVNQSFFDSFREDYPGFNEWFNKKSENEAYISEVSNHIVAFLYIKIEDERENYKNITPNFAPHRRLKIGTFKVISNGYKIGERFLKIIFDNAVINKVDEIYVTIFSNSLEKKMLINLLCDWCFTEFGKKHNAYGNELVFIRKISSFENGYCKNIFPKIPLNTDKYIVPIYPAYHTNLFPDSILNNESPIDFIENEPFRNAIQKVYISRSINREFKENDLIVFYRTGGFYKSVITTIGIVHSVIDDISSERDFLSLCRKRSVFTDKELSEHWNYNRGNRPFIVNFLYSYSFPKRINMEKLINLGIIPDRFSAPRGFEPLSDSKFDTILKETNSDERYFIH